MLRDIDDGEALPATSRPPGQPKQSDGKILFGQLRQHVSSQLCDLLDDAAIPATRVISGRRFVRWDGLPDLLTASSKQIVGLPFDFFTWTTPTTATTTSSTGTPSATPQQLVTLLHAAPLNVNILSWKKSTIEHLLDLLKDRKIRVDDASDDTVFTITLPDGRLLPVPKWPPIDLARPEPSSLPTVGIRRRDSKRMSIGEPLGDPPGDLQGRDSKSGVPSDEQDKHPVSDEFRLHSRRSSTSGMVSGLKRPRSADPGLSESDSPRKSVPSNPTDSGLGASMVLPQVTRHQRRHSVEIPSWKPDSSYAQPSLAAQTTVHPSLPIGSVPVDGMSSTMPLASTSASSKPAQTKKWTRRSSPDRVFMNTELNALLRKAGMPIPRQKDDASRLPWSSIPQFLAERGLYVTNWPEANLPWLYSGDQAMRSQPGMAGDGDGTGERVEWRDRIDWKSSPSQRSYKALATALRNGEVEIQTRQPGRDVLFEVKDPQGRKYDSTLGLSEAWKTRWMRDPVPGTVSTITSGLSSSSLPSSSLSMDVEDHDRERGRPGYTAYHTRSRSHSPHISTVARAAGVGTGTTGISAPRPIRAMPGHARRLSSGLPSGPHSLPGTGTLSGLLRSGSQQSPADPSTSTRQLEATSLRQLGYGPHQGASQAASTPSSSPTSYRPTTSFAFPPLSSSHAYGAGSPLQATFAGGPSSSYPGSSSSNHGLPSQTPGGSSYPSFPSFAPPSSALSSRRDQRDYFSQAVPRRASPSMSRRGYSPSPEPSSRLRHHPYHVDRVPSPMLLGRTSSSYSLPSLLNAGLAGPSPGRSPSRRMDSSPQRSTSLSRMDVDDDDAPFQRTLPPILPGGPLEERGSSHVHSSSDGRVADSLGPAEPSLMQYDGATTNRRRRPSTAPSVSFPSSSITAPRPIHRADSHPHRRGESSTLLSPTGLSSSSGSLLHAAPPSSSTRHGSSTPQSSSPATSTIPTHLPHPTAAFSQPVWDAGERTWTLSVRDPERASLPPLGDQVVWDVHRGVWRLRWAASVGMNTVSSLSSSVTGGRTSTPAPGGSTSSEDGGSSSQRTLGVADSPIAIWNVEQDAWVLIP